MNELTAEQRETLAAVAKIIYPHFMYIAQDDDGTVILQWTGLDKIELPSYRALAIVIEKRLQAWHAATCAVLDSIIAGEVTK